MASSDEERLKTSLEHGASQEDTVHVSGYALPTSKLLSSETRAVLQRQSEEGKALAKRCPFNGFAKLGITKNAEAFRQCFDQHYFQVLLARQKARYAVTIEPRTIAGIPTEIFIPATGEASANQRRMLINVHGGSFIMGARWGGQVESIPIAAVGGTRVISVNYRMAPEHRFPAASEDVAKIYEALLRHYAPESIGIYGCSAGGVLTAETVAWLQKEGLPRPGAVGMFCAAASYWGEGDSGHFEAALTDFALPDVIEPRENPYFKDTDPNDPLAFPARSLEIMAKFPPSLLISSTRDVALSSVVHTHSLLLRQGVGADLHVWEGLGHAFFYEPDLPESREAYGIITRFFDERLAH